MVSYPVPTEPSASQLALMDVAWSEDSVTQSSTVGTVGMFGVPAASEAENDKYYFYMQFKPFEDIRTVNLGEF